MGTKCSIKSVTTPKISGSTKSVILADNNKKKRILEDVFTDKSKS